MNRWIATVGVGLIVACWELGCVASDAEPEKVSGDQTAEPQVQIGAPSIGNVGPDIDRRPGKDAGQRPIDIQKQGNGLETVQQDAGQTEQEAGQVQDTEPEPNAILIATCESEPDEIAVPLNALDHRYCDTVQAKAYRADDEGAYEVTATYNWFIADESVAYIIPLPGMEQSGIQRPSVAYDVFWSEDPDTEPETIITVCAEPKAGWLDAQQPELCRTLPLRAVVNLDAAWCFSGTTFQSQCDAWVVVQDGRYLYVDGDGVGSVFVRDVHFYKGNYYYEGKLSSNAFMTGTVTRTDVDPHELVGTWQADRIAP